MRKDDFTEVVKALKEAAVPFLVVDGIAMIAHGYGRNAYDVDLVIRLTPDFVNRSFGALALIGYKPRVPDHA